MEKNGKAKNIVLAVLLVAVLTLSIAYAALSTTLTINSAATVKGSTWNVEFQEKSGQSALCTVTKGSASSNAKLKQGTTPSVTSTLFSGLDVEFSVPGDKVVCTWEVANKGSFDAILKTFTLGSVSATDATVQSNISYSLTYDTEDGTAVAQNNTLPKSGSTGDVKTLVLTIKYNGDYIPASDVPVTIGSTTLLYEQN